MDRLRTFGVVAHIDAGKTTLTERILFDAGAQRWLGDVDCGTATMDWMPEERSRGISITAASTRVTWGQHVLQVVDTPGHVDFIAEVERCLHVLDGVVVVIDGVRGIESQTKVVWRLAAERSLPRLVFVNKMDRVGADVDAVAAALRAGFDCRPVVLVVPLHDERGAFAGLGDAVAGAVQWFEGRPDERSAARVRAVLGKAHERVLDAAADGDDSILAAVVAGTEPEPARVRAALRRLFLAGSAVPVLAGAALFNRGVDWLLDAIVAFLPAPNEVRRTGLWDVDRAGDADAPFCGLVFKVQHVDEVHNYVRVVRGRLRPGEPCCRARPPAIPFVVPELWSMHAAHHRPVACAEPGEIVVVPGDRALRTGDTLCDPAAPPIALPMPTFPAPVLAVTFEPDQANDAPRIAEALRDLAIDDPTLRVERGHGELIVHGMGELHLDVVAAIVRARTGCGFHLSRLRVDRRETVAGPGSGEAEIHAAVAGVDRAARCALAVRPAAPGSVAIDFEPGCGSGAVRSALAADLHARLAAGVRVGPMAGIAVRVLRAEADGTDPTGEALLAQALGKAFASAIEAAGLVELEPWVELEVLAPEESRTAVLADLGARGVEVSAVSAGALGARIEGRAPLALMLGYVTRLRSITKGMGQAVLRAAGFERSPSPEENRRKP